MRSEIHRESLVECLNMLEVNPLDIICELIQLLGITFALAIEKHEFVPIDELLMHSDKEARDLLLLIPLFEMHRSGKTDTPEYKIMLKMIALKKEFSNLPKKEV